MQTVSNSAYLRLTIKVWWIITQPSVELVLVAVVAAEPRVLLLHLLIAVIAPPALGSNLGRRPVVTPRVLTAAAARGSAITGAASPESVALCLLYTSPSPRD